MLIPIKRVFVTTDREPEELLLNTEFVIKVQPLGVEHQHWPQARCLIVYRNFFEDCKPDLIYTSYDIPFIKGLYTKSRTQRNPDNNS